MLGSHLWAPARFSETKGASTSALLFSLTPTHVTNDIVSELTILVLSFFEVNVMSGVRLARSYLRGMAVKKWGRVVFVSSEAGVNNPADMIPYAMTKTAMLSISRGLAKRMTGAALLSTHFFRTNSFGSLVALLQQQQGDSGKSLDEVAVDFIKAHRPTFIVQRPANVDEVANLAVYLASLCRLRRQAPPCGPPAALQNPCCRDRRGWTSVDCSPAL